MVIRGAPAIGVAAAMGLALGVKKSKATGTQQLAADFVKNCELMAATRPTAVNLFWAIDRMKRVVRRGGAGRRIGRQIGTRLGSRGATPSTTRTWRAAARSGAFGAALVPPTARAS